MKAPVLLKNKYVLYVLLLIALVNVLGYVAMSDYNSLALFVAIGVLSTYFSKNMSVSLLVSIVVTSLVAVNRGIREGFKEGADEEKEAMDAATKLANTLEKKVDKKEGNSCQSSTDCQGKKECFKGVCSKPKPEQFQNNVPPSTPSKVGDSDESVGDRIDYAATMEQAYDNLNKMLGEGGMKGLTDETKKLVNQQKALMGTLNSMAPVLNSAKETLATMNLPNMGEMSKILNSLQQNNNSAPKIKKKE